MKRNLSLWSLAAIATAFGVGQFAGCNMSIDEESTSATWAEIVACGLDDGSVEHSATLHACDPQSTKKTTICHIPPGNPANAHTICVGNAAVPAHVNNHGDSIGACANEPPCPPPGGTGGTGGGGGEGGSSGTGGTGGDT